MIKTAMVMAAGYGTRMRPLTNDRSKAMVEVGAKPLIDHMLDRLADAGIARVVVNVHAHADHLEAHLKARTSGPEIIISDERGVLLETGGGVIKALPLLGDDPFLICNIDAIWVQRSDVLSKLIGAWQPHMDELLMLTTRQYAFGYNGAGDFNLNSSGQISRRVEAAAPHVFAGVQICRPHIFEGFKIEKFSRNKVWDKSLAREKLYGVDCFDGPHGGYWLHVGDPQARDMAEDILSDSHPWSMNG